MELRLVADTNLFFECKALGQLPWAELGHDPVVVLLTKPVLDEIDKHKKGTGRTRARALEVFGLVRTMLGTGERETVIAEAAPRVLLRLESARPDPGLKDDLDYGKTDERLVGIVSALHAAASGHAVRLFTDDTGPASTASGLDVPFQMIGAGWRRPPSESSEARRIKDLEKDLATYRAQEPRISIMPCENADASNVIAVTRRIAKPLTEIEVEEVLGALVAKHPMQTVFAPPMPSSVAKASGEVVRTEYLPPLEESVAEYSDVLYPQWIGKCRDILTRLHEGRDVKEPLLVVRWPMANIGTRPASQVRVEFKAKGPVKLVRLPEDTDEIDNSPDGTDAGTSPGTPAFRALPSPPRTPPFQENVTRTPPKLQPMSRPAGGTSVAAADIIGRGYSGIARHVSGIETAGLVSLSQRFGTSASAAAALGLLGRSSLLEPPYGAVSAVTARPMPFAIPDIAALSLSPRHDPEAFYWEWPVDEAVEMGALTCDLWRHQAGETVFEFEVCFDRDGDARGSVECAVHAENLTKPEQARCIVSRVVEHFGVRDIAEAMVEACA